MATLITKNSSTASAVPAAGDLVKGELAVNVTDKKVYTKDNSAAVVKLVGSLGNQEANAVAVTGGTINGTTIGATTPSTGAFTTASASSGFTGNLTGNVTGNVSGTAANVTGVVAIANGGTGLSALGTGVQSALGQAVTGSGSFVLSTSPSLTTPNLGTPSAAVLTNATGLPLTTGVTGTLGVANGGTGITAFGTGVATALGQNVTGSGGIVLATSPSLTTPNLGTPSAATLTNATGLPISTGVSGLGTGVATALGVAVGSAGAFVTNGGALGTPSSGTVTNLTGTASININGTVGATTPTTGAFTTTTISTSETLSYGTANGVAYLNGSKVLTTGSTLAYDGSNLLLNSGGTWATSAGGLQFSMNGNDGYITTYYDTHTVTLGAGVSAKNQIKISGSGGSNNINFRVNNSDAMALTSTGLGIGTSSPLDKLDVVSASSTYRNRIRNSGANEATLLFQNSSTGTATNDGLYLGILGSMDAYLWNYENNPIIFGTNNTERMRLDSSGNLGLGVTPTSGWRSGDRNMQIGPVMSLTSDTNVTSDVGYNYYYNTSNFPVYLTNAQASRYSQYQGAHRWFTAGSGTAGTTFSFTQAMTLDASSRLGIKQTSPTVDLDVGANDNTVAVLSVRYSTVPAYLSNSFDGTSGLTTLSVNSYNTSNGSASWSSFQNTGYGNAAVQIASNVGSADIRFLTAAAANTNPTERARITSGGDLLVGTTDSSPIGNGVKGIVLNGTDARFDINRNGATPVFVGRFTSSGTLIDFYYAGVSKGSISTDGTNVAYNTSSDYRLKNNPQPLTGSGAFIDALKPKTWNWKTDGSKGVGFIAHEVQEVSPGSVVGTKDAVDEEGKPIMQAMEYGSAEFIANIIAELQSLRARVAQLEAK